eukprot:TRINITY_DN777_c0_g1_i1.p1 TRINITY_DN777_c0_g1~~TRINITY_DN777_c0_g1_i1.p1  ORF type:complete len:221 (-),score=44.21 TRINITY_DN777_c0_g1_i1:84-746(-)
MKKKQPKTNPAPKQKIPLVTNTACCIIPPEDLWESIQTIRSEHDKSYTRWMPHINLCWPFVPKEHFVSASTMLSLHHGFQALKPFKIKLEKFKFNPNSKYLSLIPEQEIPIDRTQPETKKKKIDNKKNKKNLEQHVENSISQLHDILVELFVSSDPSVEKTFSGHLTVGQFSQDQIQEYQNKFQEEWVSLEFVVSEIYMISRSGQNEPFKVLHVVPLNSQ